MDQQRGERLDYQQYPPGFEEPEVDSGPFLSLVALVAMIALPAAVIVFLVVFA
jgi:hypothetical protein